MINLTNVLDQRLTNGPDDGTGMFPCVMNAVHARYLLTKGIYTVGSLTDTPSCTDRLIARYAQTVNDSTPVEKLTRLDDELQVRLMLAHAPSDPRANLRVRVRTQLWAAMSVPVPDDDRLRYEALRAQVNDAVRRWLDGGPLSYALMDTLDHAYHSTADYSPLLVEKFFISALRAPLQVILNSPTTGNTAAVTAHMLQDSKTDLISWLHQLLDVHEKARAEEGVLHEEIR